MLMPSLFCFWSGGRYALVMAARWTAVMIFW